MRGKSLYIFGVLLLIIGSVLLVFLLQTNNENNDQHTDNHPATTNKTGTLAGLDADESNQPARHDKQKHDDVNKLMDAWGDYILEEGLGDHNDLWAVMEDIDLQYYDRSQLYFNGLPLGDASDESNKIHQEALLKLSELLITADSDARVPSSFIRPDIDTRDNLYVWELMLCEDNNPAIGFLNSGWSGIAFHYALAGDPTTTCRSFSVAGACGIYWHD